MLNGKGFRNEYIYTQNVIIKKNHSELFTNSYII